MIERAGQAKISLLVEHPHLKLIMIKYGNKEATNQSRDQEDQRARTRDPLERTREV